MTAIRGVLCDIDGTLIDSNDALAQAYARAFAESGKDIPASQVKPLIGKGGDKLIPELGGFQEDSDAFKTVSRRRKEIYLQEYVPQLRATPGAKAFLERLKAQNIQIVAATSGAEDAEASLKHVGLDGYFDQKATSKDAARSKPDPDIIEAALKKAGLRAEEAVMIGDTPYDIEAAGKAHVAAIALLTGGWKREDLAQAAAVYASPQDLLVHFEQSLLHSPTN